MKERGRGSVAEGSRVGPRERKRDESRRKARSSESGGRERAHAELDRSQGWDLGEMSD